MRKRFDLAMVERGLVPTRSRARDLIRHGKVSIDGQVCTKPALEIDLGRLVSIAPDTPLWVSRGATKLEAALDAFECDPDGRIALDIGASTGGFTEILLMRGAKRVYAVDVGHGQLHQRLKDDPRVVSLEGCDARSLNKETIPESADAIVADVSFISLAKALGPALKLAAPGAWLLALVKPQFEVGPNLIGKGGIVRDEAARHGALAQVREWVAAQPGWRAQGVMSSPIKGGSGNEEFLLHAVQDE